MSSSDFLQAVWCSFFLIFCKSGGALSTSISKHPIVLVVSYDGFRFDYFDKVETPAMDAFKASGVSMPYLQPVFPTKTFPNHQSIATGVYAETHGIVDNSLFDPEYNSTLSGGNNDPRFWNYNPEILPVWIHNELAGDGRTSGCLMWPGDNQPYGPTNDYLPTFHDPIYDPSLRWEERVDTVISWMTSNASNPANLVFLYYDEPDTHGHAFGPNAPETLREISASDNRTGYLVRKLKDAGIFDQINLILLSDHGMKEVTPSRIINITSMLDPSLLERRYGTTPYLNLTPKKGQGDKLYYSLLLRSLHNNFTIYKKSELRSEPFHYATSRRIMDYVVVADPGYAFDDFYSSYIAFYNEKYNLTASPSREYGVHGYSNLERSMAAFLIAHGPAFKTNHRHTPIHNIDVVPLISVILGIPQPPTNGSLERVLGMLKPEFLQNHRPDHYFNYNLLLSKN